MENLAEKHVAQEKNFFLSLVKKNPVFLLQHFKSLSSVMVERFRVKILSKLRGAYRSDKITPAWLRGLNIPNQSHCRDLCRLLQTIPKFNLNPQTNLISDLPWEEQSDIEVYFAHQRWGVLTDELLAQESTQPPAEVIAQMQQPIALECYSICERIANLINWVAYKSPGACEVPSASCAFLEKAMQWVLKHLEFYGKRTGNHILNNARSLILAGTVLENKFAVTTGWLIFQNMLPVLVQPDGFLRERSSHYQLIVLGWLLDAYVFLQASASYSPQQLQFLLDYINKMRSAAAALCDKSGNLLVFIGDISPDLSPVKTTQRLSSCHSAFWPAPAVPPGLHDDWCILQSAHSKVILNCPTGRYPKLFSSHGHNDITSLVWLYQDLPLLIDSGRARYTKDTISIFQKSAYGHNVPLVNGFAPLSESLVINGNWWPTPYASAQVAITSTASHQALITHNGFKRATPVTQHQRQIVVDDDQLWIEDFFKGHGVIDLELRWQLAPNFKALAQENLFSNGLLQLEIDLSGMQYLPKLEYHVTLGRVSTQYGVAQTNPVITMRWQVQLPFTTTLVFKVKSCVA